MGKLLKILLSIGVVAIGLLAVLAIALVFIVDPNDYKAKIAAEVEKQTGRMLVIEGDISLSVFPWLGLDIGETSLSNAAGFGEAPMARMDAVQVRVKLLPLLRKELEMDTARLSGLRLNLARAADGSTNWDDLLAGRPEAPAGEERTAPPAEPGGERLGSLAIGGIEVTGAELVWDDQVAGSRYEIRDLAIRTGAIEPGEPFDLELGFSVAATQPAVSGTFGLTGGVWFAESLQALRIEGARLDAELAGETVPGGRQQVSLASDISLDLEQQVLELPQLVLEVLGMTISGQASGSGIGGDAPQFRGDVAIAEFVPREVIAALGEDAPETADATVLGKADAALQWEASASHFAATSLTAHLDDTRLGGTARVENFAAPAIRFDLQLDAIDVDRYLPPPAESPQAAPSPATAAGGGAGMLPVETLRGLNLEGTLTLGSLKAYNLRSTNIEMKVRARDGLVRIHPAGAVMYQGQYTGDISIDARRDTPGIAINERLAGIQAGPLLRDLTGDDKLLGRGDLAAKLTASGNTPEAMKRTLNGDVSFAFTEGAVKGINIAALIRNAQAKLQGQPLPPAGNEPEQTDFAELKGTARLTNGIVRNEDLSMKSPLLRITGQGEVDLPDETIDYELTTKIVGSLEGQGGKALQELKGVAIPIRVGGTFSKPTWTPDLGSAVGDVVKKKAKKEIEKKSRDLLKDKLDDQLLKGLFK